MKLLGTAPGNSTWSYYPPLTISSEPGAQEGKGTYEVQDRRLEP